MDENKKIVAENISRLRNNAKMTQAELAEKLNYSDKAVSKWERGESIPDVFVLREIAVMYNTTVDYLLEKHDDSDEIPQRERVRHHSRKMITAVSLIAAMIPFLIAFVVLWLRGEILWVLFIYAIPVLCILWLVFNSIWGIPMNNIYLISGILWGILLSIWSSFLYFDDQNYWPLFLIGIPGEMVIILSFFIKNRTDVKKRDK